MKMPLLLSCLLSLSALRADEEIAAIFRNEDEVHISELEYLKNEIRALRRQVETLSSRSQHEPSKGEEVEQLKEQISSMQVRFEVMAKKLHAVSERTAEIAFLEKTPKPAPTPAPAPIPCPSPCYLGKEEPCKQHGIYAGADWLYWQVRQAGMQYATSYNNIAGDLANAHSKSFDFDWKSGWRVNAGYNTPRDGWDLHFSYTQFSPEAHSDASGILFPYLLFQGAPSFGTVVHNASGSWKIDLNSWDLELGRVFQMAKTFRLRPHAGVKQAWIDQNATVLYTGNPDHPTDQYLIQLKDDFSGFGLQAGLDSNWKLWQGFSFFGDLSAALLWGKFDIEQNQIIATVPQIQLKDPIKALAPMIDAKLGFSWDQDFFCDRFHFGLDVAFEMQYWWQQNIYDRFTSTTFPTSVKTTYDLGLFGLSLGGRFGF